MTFCKGVSGREVWITRSIQSGGVETVPSRWLNRLSNLINGLSSEATHPLMEQMKARGAMWRAICRAWTAPIPSPPAPRPAPCPPALARPKALSVTQIKTLVRDPYAIYAAKVLGLEPLDPLTMEPDARLRGVLIHKILAQVFKDTATVTPDTLLATATQILTAEVPRPAIRAAWLARMRHVADWLLTGEALRRDGLLHSHLEIGGEVTLPDLDFRLRGVADRIDMRTGGAWIYDYKTGTPPTEKQQRHFDKQLLLEVEMLKRGGFGKIGRVHVLGASFLGLGAKMKEVPAPMDDSDVWSDLHRLLALYLSADQPFTARRAMLSDGDVATYDHLSRFGEWDCTQDSVKVILP